LTRSHAEGKSAVKLRYPIVLVHGIAAKDGLKLFSFWGRIPEIIRAEGIEVHLGGTDAWGRIEGNALLLKATIDRITDAGGTEKVNIVAHSKGGIDSRFLISAFGYSAKIASLTTIDTPHRGSEIADLAVRQRPLSHPLTKKALRRAGLLYGDRNPDPYEAAMELTTESMRAFNARYPDSPEVRYRSLYTRMHGPLDDLSLFFPYLYIRSKAGDNDGVVSSASARWGPDSELIDGEDGGISHAEIVDYKRAEVSGMDIPRIYLGIAADLAAAGL
jgi:triacylglycerol lipase